MAPDWRMAGALCCALGMGLGPAAGVTGGTPSDGPLARAAVMVLSSRGGVCSAVVVAPDIVLTAAHCAAAGDQHRVHFSEAGAPVLIEPVARAAHPGYVPGAVRERRRSIDLALLRLPEPLPARFRAATLGGDAPRAGTMMLLGGYGVAREGDARSTGTFRESRLPVIEPYGRSTILVWLSDPARPGVGACQGDSGGPIADGAGGVVALTTWASGAGTRNCGTLSQGTLLAPQRPWLDGVLTGWGRRAVWAGG